MPGWRQTCRCSPATGRRSGQPTCPPEFIRRPSDAQHPDSEAGFTLVEVLVAFAIVAIGMVTALQVAGTTRFGLSRVASVDVVSDEVPGIVALRAARGWQAGIEQGTFSNGEPWTLSVAEIGREVGWHQVPPLWRVRMTRGGPEGPPVYLTVMAGAYGG